LGNIEIDAEKANAETIEATKKAGMGTECVEIREIRFRVAEKDLRDVHQKER
jgi:hypothetical protein